MTDPEKILISGVCYVQQLLRTRFEQDRQLSGQNYLKNVNPDFDISKVDFFRDDLAEQFLFTDFNGKYSSLELEAKDLPSLLELYSPMCRRMYVVGSMGIDEIEANRHISRSEWKKISVFWMFLFNTNWNPTDHKKWASYRDRALFALLYRHAQLRFILYDERSVKWWREAGMPEDRMIYWHIDWQISLDELEDRKAAAEAEGKRITHRYPTEDSYNELLWLIQQDCKNQKTDVVVV